MLRIVYIGGRRHPDAAATQAAIALGGSCEVVWCSDPDRLDEISSRPIDSIVVDPTVEPHERARIRQLSDAVVFVIVDDPEARGSVPPDMVAVGRSEVADACRSVSNPAVLQGWDLGSRPETGIDVPPVLAVVGRDALIDWLDEILAIGPTLAQVHVIGADRLRWVNDALGHRAGDELVTETLRRLREAAGAGGHLGRMGSDEFVVLQIGPDLEEQAERLERRLSAPFDLSQGLPISVSFSIGTAELTQPIDPSSGAEVIRRAGAAYREAKRTGGARRIIYTPGLDARAAHRLSLEQDLRRSLEAGDLELHYQPIVDLSDGSAVGFEALVRWEHPIRGRLMPTDFIGLAEETGLITRLGEYVLDAACTQLQTWVSEHPDTALSVSVNVSALQLARTDLLEVVGRSLDRSGLDPGRLVIEVTEGSVIEDPDSARVTMQELNALGVRLHADDFGTGYAGLSALRMFPLSALKIDHSFVRGLGSDPTSMAFIKAIVQLARDLGIGVIAEGIETFTQHDALLDAGVQLGQGHRFSPAVAPEHLKSLKVAGQTLELSPAATDLGDSETVIDLTGPEAIVRQRPDRPTDGA